MQIHWVETDDFRLLAPERVELDPGVNVITGANAQGKTTLLEAVWLLTGNRSFRTRFDRELIAFGEENAMVCAELDAALRRQRLEIRLAKGRARSVKVNGVRRKSAELGESRTAVLFCPDDLQLIRGGAANRRRMMDAAISQLRPGYAVLCADFLRLYENKTRILRDWREKPSLLDALDEFSDGMARASAQLIRYRAAFAARLDRAAAPIHRDFSDGAEERELQYRTVSTVREPFASAKESYSDLCAH